MIENTPLATENESVTEKTPRYGVFLLSDLNDSAVQRSTSAAHPMPPPTQSVARPFFASRRFIS